MQIDPQTTPFTQCNNLAWFQSNSPLLPHINSVCCQLQAKMVTILPSQPRSPQPYDSQARRALGSRRPHSNRVSTSAIWKLPLLCDLWIKSDGDSICNSCNVLWIHVVSVEKVIGCLPALVDHLSFPLLFLETVSMKFVNDSDATMHVW